MPSGQLGHAADNFIVANDAGVGYSLITNGWAYKVIGGYQLYWNYVAILLKRVSSGTWIELRWHSVNHLFWNSGNTYILNIAGTPTSLPAPLFSAAPYAFEIVCSHNAAGSASVTSLAHWDYPDLALPVGSVSGNLYPGVNFNPQSELRWLECEMLDNVITWSLWDQYPTPSVVGSPHKLQSGSYAIPSGLQPIIGTGVAGHTGWSQYVSNTSDSSNFTATANNAPFIHYFESSKADQAEQELPIGVIGDIETPPTIVLRGGMIDPLLTMINTSESGEQLSSYARFIGTFLDNNPVTIDVNSGHITDAAGSNAYNLLQPGSDFLNFRPGINRIGLKASNWDSNAADHAEVHWRDALT